mgnify:CR=1 FL=1
MISYDPNNQPGPEYNGPVSGGTFEYTGNPQTFVVPVGVTELRVKVWGAGGAGRTGSYDNFSGGSGGFTTTKLSVTPGEQLSVVVGGGGKHGAANGGDGGWPNGGYGTSGDASGGGGGGLTGVFTGDPLNGNG